MNKKLITALLSLTLIVPVTVHTASAATPAPTIAILDTALDSSLPALQGKVVQEVCILQYGLCPNGQSFMEGPGSAAMSASTITMNGFDHGTQMASVFVRTNPNANIVFVRIIGDKAGVRQPAGEATVYNALNWVRDNASKYNIQGVSMSQGHHNIGAAGTDYCPKTPVTEQAVKDLIAIGIPTFFPSGNGRDYTRIDWPACLDVSVSVGYVDQQNEISSSSNNDSVKLDFFAPGFFTTAGPGNVVKNISGSSSATQVMAANWIAYKTAKPSASYDQILDSFRKTAVSTIGRQGTFTKLVDLTKSLSYTSSVISAPAAPSGPTAAEIAAAKAAADKLIADKAAADAAAAKATLQAQANAAIAAAEAQYQIDLKAAQDKLAATKATWLAKLNG
jgi:hypothetical protein